MKTLVCTVGGTPEPVLAAIRSHTPDRVIFVCSKDDPASGRSGSYVEVESRNPSIPMRADLSPDAWSIVKVPADDPATIICELKAVMEAATAAGTCVADYTAGTKSMCAALFYVAVQTPNVVLSLVTGPRSDLVRVASGMERVRRVDSASVHALRLKTSVAESWARFAYADASLLLAAADSAWIDSDLERAAAMSRAFSAWDRWDHAGALEVLKGFGAFAGALLAPLNELTKAEDRRSDAYRIVDMHASVLRREKGHQFDAAVLRLYRVLEWIAQWTLKWDCGVDASDVSADSAIVHLAHVAPNGRLVMACDSAWKAVAELDGPLKAVAGSLGQGIRDLALRRNDSLLAHGRRVLDASDVETCRALLHGGVWPAFIKASRVREYQLPTVVP